MLNFNNSDSTKETINEANAREKAEEIKADLKALAALQDTLNQACIWAYNAWTDAHNALSEKAMNEKFIEMLAEPSLKLDALEIERARLVKLYETNLANSETLMKRKTKSELIAEAKKTVSTKKQSQKTA